MTSAASQLTVTDTASPYEKADMILASNMVPISTKPVQVAAASNQLQEIMTANAALPPSKIQNVLSELFRIALCRNDDYNLAGSSTIRCTKQFNVSSSQLVQGQISAALAST